MGTAALFTSGATSAATFSVAVAAATLLFSRHQRKAAVPLFFQSKKRQRFGAFFQAKSIDRDKLTANKLTAKRRFRYSGFVTNFVVVISSQIEGLGKMALGIVKIYLGSPFSANRRCLRSVCSRSVGSRSLCRGQLSWASFFFSKFSFATANKFLRRLFSI